MLMPEFFIFTECFIVVRDQIVMDCTCEVFYR